jgi:DDE superfamily endonuclease
MAILRALANDFQALFPATDKGQERFRWLILTLQAIIVPITASRTSNLLRAIETLFGVSIAEWRYYTFMASAKLPWERLWHLLWRRIPNPLSEGRLLLALDDSINPKTGKKIFACQRTFDHAGKTNQTRYPWAQTILTLGLLKKIHGRWSCLPLAFDFYLRRKSLEGVDLRLRGQALVFRSKFEQAVQLIHQLGKVFPDARMLIVTDTWFGNNGLLKPLLEQLGARAQLLSRLRVNTAVYAIPEPTPRRGGRPRKYGARLGSAAQLAVAMRQYATPYTLHVYGALREVVAADRIVMLKSLRRRVRVVWVYHKSQWLALLTTDLDLSVEQIIEYYSARWKIEAGFREIKQEIGSCETQTRKPESVTNHLNFCMAATTITWIYAGLLPQAPARRYASQKTTEFAFADARRSLAKHLADEGFGIVCQNPRKLGRIPLISTVMRLVA